jgi:hypothetical protein
MAPPVDGNEKSGTAFPIVTARRCVALRSDAGGLLLVPDADFRVADLTGADLRAGVAGPFLAALMI